MPFWRGDGPGRPLDFGRAIDLANGRLVVGAPTSSVVNLEDGAVYVFDETPSGFVETERASPPVVS